MSEWKRPERGEIITATVHPDAIDPLSNVYGEEVLLAILREIGSDEFEHGDATEFSQFWNEMERILTLEGNGNGVKPENEKYFFGQDIGEGGQDVHKSNHFRIGMRSVSKIANEDTITINNKDYTLVIRWFGNNLRQSTIVWQGKNTSGKTGVIHKLQIKDSVQITQGNLIDISKLLWFFRIINDGRKVFVDGIEIMYPELTHPEMFCNGGTSKQGIFQYIDSPILSTKKGIINGKIFLNVQKNRPLWFPDKDYMALYYKNDYRLIRREYHGGFGIAFLNTNDEEIGEKLNAGKMTVANYPNTDFYNVLHQYVQDTYQVDTPTPKNIEEYINDLMQFCPINNILNEDNGIQTPIKPYKKNVIPRYIWTKKGTNIINPIHHKSNYKIISLNDENLPFFFPSIENGEPMINVNSQEKEGVKLPYPEQTMNLNADINNGKFDRWFTYVSRIKRAFSDGIDEFYKNNEQMLRDMTIEDKATESSLRIFKRKNKDDEEE
jgi:hypothetical protein